MYTFWYSNQYQQLRRELKEKIRDERAIALLEESIDPNQAKIRKQLVRHATSCLHALDQLTHFLYWTYNETHTTDLLEDALNTYKLQDRTEALQAMREKINMVVADVTYQKQLKLHQWQYVIWVFGGALMIGDAKSLAQSLMGFFCVLNGIEGLTCNYALHTGETMKAMLLFIDGMERFEKAMSDAKATSCFASP